MHHIHCSIVSCVVENAAPPNCTMITCNVNNKLASSQAHTKMAPWSWRLTRFVLYSVDGVLIKATLWCVTSATHDRLPFQPQSMITILAIHRLYYLVTGHMWTTCLQSLRDSDWPTVECTTFYFEFDVLLTVYNATITATCDTVVTAQVESVLRLSQHVNR